MSRSVVLLVSSISSGELNIFTGHRTLMIVKLSFIGIQEINQRRAEDILIGNDLIIEKIDGVIEDNRSLRDALFEISKQRGKYPQVFITKGTDNYEFIGLFDDLESISESSTIPAEILAANPGIRTMSSVFGECKSK